MVTMVHHNFKDIKMIFHLPIFFVLSIVFQSLLLLVWDINFLTFSEVRIFFIIL